MFKAMIIVMFANGMFYEVEEMDPDQWPATEAACHDQVIMMLTMVDMVAADHDTFVADFTWECRKQ